MGRGWGTRRQGAVGAGPGLPLCRRRCCPGSLRGGTHIRVAFRVRAQRHPWTAWGSGLCSQQPAGPQRALGSPGSRGDPLTVAVSPPGGCRLQPRQVITAEMSGESCSGLCSGGSCVSVPLGHVPGWVSPAQPPAAPLGAQPTRPLPQGHRGCLPAPSRQKHRVPTRVVTARPGFRLRLVLSLTPWVALRFGTGVQACAQATPSVPGGAAVRRPRSAHRWRSWVPSLHRRARAARPGGGHPPHPCPGRAGRVDHQARCRRPQCEARWWPRQPWDRGHRGGLGCPVVWCGQGP